jgi:lactoylglutathione lyase
MISSFEPRMLHTMLRVHDLPKMLNFYCAVLGMRELRRIEMPELRRTLVFIGYAGSAAEAQVEFWHDWDTAGTAVPHEPSPGHLGIGVRDIAGCVRDLAAEGVPVRREPAPLRPGGRVIAMIEDPEGHEIELLAID